MIGALNNTGDLHGIFSTPRAGSLTPSCWVLKGSPASCRGECWVRKGSPAAKDGVLVPANRSECARRACYEAVDIPNSPHNTLLVMACTVRCGASGITSVSRDGRHHQLSEVMG